MLDLLRSLPGRLLGASQPTVLPLRIVSEFGCLREVSDIGRIAMADLPEPGVMSRWADPAPIDEADLVRRLAGRTGGVNLPPWADGSGGAPVFGVSLCRVRNVVYAPEFGAVIVHDGRVLHSSVAEALYFTPSLTGLPNVLHGEDGPAMTLPSRMTDVGRASIFMAWGGRFNYGHFLLDCLSSLALIADMGLLGRYPALTPPLTAWQAEAVRLLLGPEAARVRETTESLVWAKDLVFATTMDHFLHAPNTPLDKVRTRMLSAVQDETKGPARVYLSRRRDDKRRVTNELELEAALQRRGFEIVHPAELPVSRQVALFRDADVIVGATGAAFSNCLFCKPSAKVFEIQPVSFMGIWARAVCHYAGADWHGYFVACPEDEGTFYVEGALKPGVMFEWSIPLPEFLSFLDERL